VALRRASASAHAEFALARLAATWSLAFFGAVISSAVQPNRFPITSMMSPSSRCYCGLTSTMLSGGPHDEVMAEVSA
jgi:hypothetical protein